MGLNIKNEDVHDAVRELARVLGVSRSSAVEVAVRAKLAELDEGALRWSASDAFGQAPEAQEAYRGVDLTGDVEDLYDPATGLPR